VPDKLCYPCRKVVADALDSFADVVDNFADAVDNIADTVGNSFPAEEKLFLKERVKRKYGVFLRRLLLPKQSGKGDMVNIRI